MHFIDIVTIVLADFSSYFQSQMMHIWQSVTTTTWIRPYTSMAYAIGRVHQSEVALRRGREMPSRK